MSIPRKVKLGAVDIAIVPVKDLNNASENCGLSTAFPPVIYVDRDVETASTLIHELIHHVMWRRGMNDHEEALVVQLENLIAAIICDNPGTIRWLVDQIAGIARQAKQAKSSKRKRK